VFASATGVVIHEPNRCTGCLLCETSCTAVNDGKVSQHLARIKVSGNYQYGKEGPRGAWQQRAGEMGNFLLTAETCRQCERPACALACPEGAIFQETKAGAREVDPSKCVGCGTCVRACPWEIPVVDTETDVATKCVLCHGYSACVSVCPTNALHFVGWDDAIRRYREHFVTDTV
jgi:Fe-S-cluster-containing dehydrogenase component